MKNILLGILIVLTGFIACQDDNLPGNPTLTAPISGLIITVNGEDYTATPQLKEDGSLTENYILSVKIPSQAATVKEIYLSDNSFTADVKAGDNIQFVDNMLPITLSKKEQSKKYYIKMSYNPPPFMYFIKSSDRDADGNRYYLATETADRIASGTYDTKYEGYVDLTTSNWDNIGLISSDKTTYYDYAGGPWPAVSAYTWTGVEKAGTGSDYFPCDGPWNDWKTVNGNAEIVSPGVWKINYDSETKQVEMVEVQWAVSGSAISSKTAMTYSATNKTWSLTAQLVSGSFKFTTIPVSAGDPEVTYGLATGISQLASDGKDISISEAGTYTITLSLSNPPYYSYTLTK